MSKDKIEVSIKDIPEIIEQLKQVEKEIEFERKSKNLFIDVLYKVCEMSLKQSQEIERLNNIIKGLEKWLSESEYFNGRKLRQDYITVCVTDVLDKIKELKGDN